MNETLKKTVLEVAELVKQLPEKLQEKAFEMVLAHELARTRESKKPDEHEDAGETEGANKKNSEKDADDLQMSDLHVKAKKFLEKQGLSIDHINQLFYKEGRELKPLYEDLKTSKTSESQIRLGLLAALRNGLESGEFQFDGEDVRQQCQVRKCYDAANFTATFKNKSKLFESFSAYAKDSPLKLSEQGRKELADVIKELQ